MTRLADSTGGFGRPPAPAVPASRRRPEVCDARIADQEVLLDPAGILYWPGQAMLVVSDLHLEKASSRARRRQFLPPYDTRATLTALAATIDRYRPRTVLCLGDSFHDVGAGRRMAARDLEAVADMQRGRTWIWIAGNHDPCTPPNLAGENLDVLAVGPLTFRHEPLAGPSRGEVAGHLHPSGKVRRYGCSVRRRCFATDGDRLVMPAFGAFTGGLNVLDGAWRRIFDGRRFHAMLLGADRVFAIPGSALQHD